MRQRSIGMCIVLSIVTCGIYGFYWLYCLANDCNELAGDSGTSAGTVVLLDIVTCGIYGWYWCYKSGDQINAAKRTRGLEADNNLSVLYLVLAIFGFQIISWALIQNEINKMVPAA